MRNCVAAPNAAPPGTIRLMALPESCDVVTENQASVRRAIRCSAMVQVKCATWSTTAIENQIGSSEVSCGNESKTSARLGNTRYRVIPVTTTNTLFFATDRHGGGDATSCSMRVASRCDSASLPAGLSPGGAGRGGPGSRSSGPATGELLSATRRVAVLARQDLGLLGVELGVAEHTL